MQETFFALKVFFVCCKDEFVLGLVVVATGDLRLSLSLRLCHTVLQHCSRFTSSALDTSNCGNQILCSICILHCFSLLHYSFLHFFISLWLSSLSPLSLSFSLPSSSIFIFCICICSCARMRHAAGWRTICVIYLAYLEQVGLYILYTIYIWYTL